MKSEARNSKPEGNSKIGNRRPKEDCPILFERRTKLEIRTRETRSSNGRP